MARRGARWPAERSPEVLDAAVLVMRGAHPRRPRPEGYDGCQVTRTSSVRCPACAARF